MAKFRFKVTRIKCVSTSVSGTNDEFYMWVQPDGGAPDRYPTDARSSLNMTSIPSDDPDDEDDKYLNVPIESDGVTAYCDFEPGFDSDHPELYIDADHLAFFVAMDVDRTFLPNRDDYLGSSSALAFYSKMSLKLTNGNHSEYHLYTVREDVPVGG